MSSISKISSTADLLGGTVFYATADGCDPEYNDNDRLLPNGMYIRLIGSDNSIAYISAYEIDKTIDIITNVCKNKASKGDLDSLRLLLNDKSSLTDFNILKGIVDNKVSKSEVDDVLDKLENTPSNDVIDEIILQLNQKASTEVVDSLSKQIKTKVNKDEIDNLLNIIGNKVDNDEIKTLVDDITALKETVKLLTNTDAISSINAQIEYLYAQLQLKLSWDDVSDINDKVAELISTTEQLDSQVKTWSSKIDSKASNTYVQGELSKIDNAINNLYTQVDEKANRADIATKADKTSVDSIIVRVNDIESDVVELQTTVGDHIEDTKKNIAAKADKKYVDNSVDVINDSIGTKVNISDFNDAKQKINNDITELKSQHQDDVDKISSNIDRLECEVNGALNDANYHINLNTNNIASTKKDISELKKSNQKHDDQLKHNWVRVLTTKEYKELLTNPSENAPYSKYYKYPNVVYLVVDYNRPKAIYIGDILIAKAEQNGDVGFTYSFPIVF